MEHKTDWIRVEDKLPEFDKVVLLYEFRDDKHYASTGYLAKINAQGNHFVTYQAKDFSSIFGDAFGGTQLNPTHWAYITIPED